MFSLIIFRIAAKIIPNSCQAVDIICAVADDRSGRPYNSNRSIIAVAITVIIIIVAAVVVTVVITAGGILVVVCIIAVVCIVIVV